MKTLIFTLLVTMPWLCLYAGNEAGNGGDTCENRIKIIGSDIESWILGGGSNGLELKGSSVEQYNRKMLEAIRSAVVSCTEDKIIIANVEKTCRNFTSVNGLQNIECNFKRFDALTEAEQYNLVHHEYAGLAGLEINNGPSSDYSISNQISTFLEDQVVKKLVIKKKQNHYGPKDLITLRKNMTSVFEYYRFFDLITDWTAKITSVFEKTARVCLDDHGCYLSDKEKLYVSDSSVSVSLEDGRVFRFGDVVTDGKTLAEIVAIQAGPSYVKVDGQNEKLDRAALLIDYSKGVVWANLSKYQKQIE